MKKRMRKISFIMVIVLCLAIFAGCSGTSKSTASKELILVPPSMVPPFYTMVANGATPAAESVGYKCTIVSPENSDNYAEQVALVEDMIEKRVAGIAICAHDDQAIVTAVKKANEAKIPIVIFNSLTDLPGGDVYAYVGYEQSAGGAKVAEWVVKKLNGKGKVAILEGLPGMHTNERKGGFVDYLKDYPEIEVVASQAADWDREKGMNVATNMLQANPDIDVFYGLNDEMAIGAGQACKAMGRDDVMTVGIDGIPNSMEAVKEGTLTGSLYVGPVEMGEESMKLLAAAIEGKDPPAGKRIVIETTVVDLETVDQYL